MKPTCITRQTCQPNGGLRNQCTYMYMYICILTVFTVLSQQMHQARGINLRILCNKSDNFFLQCSHCQRYSERGEGLHHPMILFSLQIKGQWANETKIEVMNYWCTWTSLLPAFTSRQNDPDTPPSVYKSSNWPWLAPSEKMSSLRRWPQSFA